MRQVAVALERVIRQHSEQWFLFHDLWDIETDRALATATAFGTPAGEPVAVNPEKVLRRRGQDRGMTHRVIALIPAYNEAARVGEVVARARRHVDEVVVIDDGSNDGTAAVAEKAGAKILRHEQNRGKGGAIATALDYFGHSDAEFAMLLDADGQHDPAEITKFVETADREQADIVVGNRMGDTEEMPVGAPAHQPVHLLGHQQVGAPADTGQPVRLSFIATQCPERFAALHRAL